jgi:hypothetical protein
MIRYPSMRPGKAVAALGLAAALAGGSSLAALAQPADPNYQNQAQDYQDKTQDYQNKVQDYQAKKDAYDAQKQSYQDQRARYRAQQDNYDQQRQDYERDRADYDARYGAGAFDTYVHSRVYLPAGEREGYVSNDPYAPYRNSPCEARRDSNTAAGGVIGALAGAAIGSNLASGGGRTGGAILGGVAGAALGANIGRSTAACDDAGYYYGYDQTYPYQEDTVMYRDRPSGQYGYDWYMRHGCRLAVAPAYYSGVSDYRYVRVCPDGAGRFRMTD